jgi:hypothetical protein
MTCLPHGVCWIPPGGYSIAVLSAMASRQIGAHKTFQISREFGMTELSWEVASDWIFWPGELDYDVIRYLLLIGSSGKGNWTDCDVMWKLLLMDHIGRYFL